MSQGGKTLTLLAAPARVAGPAYALIPIAGVPGLTDADTRPRGAENLAIRAEIMQGLARLMAAEDLPALLASRGLPPADPFRLGYPELARVCLLVADLLARVENLIAAGDIASLTYIGPDDWRRRALQALAAAHGLGFTWRRRHHRRARLETGLRSLRSSMFRLRDQRHNARRTRETPVDTILMSSLPRMAMGLTPVIDGLGKVLLAETRTGAFAGLVSPERQQAAWRLAGELPRFGRTDAGDRELLARFRGRENEPNAFAWYNGVPLDETLRAVAAEELGEMVATVRALHRLLRENPNALVVATLEQEALLEVPRAAGRQVVVGQVCGLSEYYRLLPGEGLYLAVSDADADGMATVGIRRDQIVVCGHAYYDLHRPDADSAARAAAGAAALRQRLGIEPDRYMALLVDTNNVAGLVERGARENGLREMYSGLKAALAETGGVVVVKPRPGGTKRTRAAARTLHQRLAGEAGIGPESLIVAAENSIAPFIAACDVMLMFNSTAGIEAIAHDKPIVNVHDVGIDAFGYTATQAVIDAAGAAEIAKAIDDLRRDGAARQALARGREVYRQRYLHAQDGAVAPRILAAIAKFRQAGATTKMPH